MTDSRSYDVFITYHESDADWVDQQLTPRLQAAGLTWLDPYAFTAGVPKTIEIERAIRCCRRTLLVLSPAFLQDHWQNFIVPLTTFYGLDTGRWLAVPLIVQPCLLPQSLLALAAVDLSRADRRAWDQLIATLQAPAAPPAFPDSPSLSVPGCAIPPAASAVYIPRGAIEDQVRQRLRSPDGVAAIVGLHAPGGVGKSELAKRVALDLAGEFERVLWVELGSKTPAQVVGDMAAQCQLSLPPAASYSQQAALLRQRLGQQRLLVVLDDVRPENAAALKDFLPPSPPGAALITSRMQHFSAIPRPATFALDAMTPEQAWQLLEANLSAPALAAESQAARQLAGLCAHNPLALDIAARRIAQTPGQPAPIAAFNQRLQRRGLAELKAGSDPRLNLMRVFDESYDSLDEADQRRYRRLAAFAAVGFSPVAAAAVWEEGEDQAWDALLRLAGLSLARLLPQPAGPARARLHDLLIDHAGSKLTACGEETETHRALAEWLVGLFNDNYTITVERLPVCALELDNLRAAAGWALAQGEGRLLARLATKPRNWLYNVFRAWEDWRNWLTGALALEIEDDWLKANVLTAIGDVQQFRKEMDAALDSYAQALALFKQVGDHLGEANVLKAIGDVQQFRDQRDAALDSYAQALALFKQVGDHLGEANVLAALSRLAILQGDLSTAESQLQAATLLRRAVKSLYNEGVDQGKFARALIQAGYRPRARPYAERALAIMRQIGEAWLIRWAEQLVENCEEEPAEEG